MADASENSAFVVVAVAPQTITANVLKQHLQAACRAAEVSTDGISRLLGAAHGWTAIEQNIKCNQASLATARAAFTRALNEIGIDGALLSQNSRRKTLLVSDMDSTIIEQECLDELADFAGLKAEISAVTARAMRGELDFDTALRERVAKLERLPLTALQACFDTKLTLMPGARTLTATMRAHGAYCLLVSGGFTFFTERVAQRAGFQGHRGNTLLDDGTALTGQVGDPILGRTAKRDFLDDAAFANGITRKDALAMGDGANDLAMIEAAGLGIAVHAKPIVAEAADASVQYTDLTSILYYQGYTDADIIWSD